MSNWSLGVVVNAQRALLSPYKRWNSNTELFMGFDNKLIYIFDVTKKNVKFEKVFLQ